MVFCLFVCFVVFFLKESKDPALNENFVQEKITSTQPAIVMSEIPLENIFDDASSKEPEIFVEKGLNDAETKEMKPDASGTATSTTTSTRVVTTSRTVVKGDGSPVTTVEKKVIVNGEEQPVDTNLLSPPIEAEADERAEEESEEGGEREAGEKEEAEGAEGGKPRQKVKKKRSFKKTFQGIIHRRSKSERDDDEEKS